MTKPSMIQLNAKQKTKTKNRYTYKQSFMQWDTGKVD